MLPATLQDFVLFLGTPAFVGFLAAHVLIFIPAYMNLSSAWKGVVEVVLNGVFAVVSVLIINLVSPSTLAALQPVYAIIAAFIMAWIGHSVTMNGIMLNRALKGK